MSDLVTFEALVLAKLILGSLGHMESIRFHLVIIIKVYSITHQFYISVLSCLQFSVATVVPNSDPTGELNPSFRKAADETTVPRKDRYADGRGTAVFLFTASSCCIDSGRLRKAMGNVWRAAHLIYLFDHRSSLTVPLCAVPLH